MERSIMNKNMKVYETIRRQNVRAIKYNEVFSSEFDIIECKFGMTIKEIVNSMPTVLSDIISNYITEECNNCDKKVFELYDKTIKHIPSLYQPIPQTEEKTWRSIYPNWFKDYRLCKDCITNVCGMCNNILIKNEIYKTDEGTLICDECYGSICDRCGGYKQCFCTYY